MAAVQPSRIPSESDDRSRSDLLMRAIETGDGGALQLWLADDLDVNASTPYGTTALMIAAANGQDEIVRILIERGAAIDATRSDGFTALALAVFFGHDEVVRVLLACGADLNATGRTATSPEMWAAARGFFRLGDLLKIEAEQRAKSPSEITLVSKPAVSEAATNSSSDAAKRSEETTLLRPPVNSIININDYPNSMDSKEYNEIPIVELDEAAAEIKAARELDSTVAFSPFVSVLDRMGTNRLPMAAALMFVIMATVVTLTVIKVIKRTPVAGNSTATVATSPSAKPEQRPALVVQPVPLAAEQTATSANVPTEKAAEQVSLQSSDHTASTNGLPDEEASPKHSEAKQRVTKTISSYSSDAPKSSRRKSRQDEVVLSDNKGSLTDATSPIPSAPKPPITQARSSSTSSDVPPLQVEPIKGSSTKRKVIQWP